MVTRWYNSSAMQWMYMCGDFAPGYPLVLVSLAWRSDWAVAVAIAHSIHAVWNTLRDVRKLFKQLEDIVVLVRGQFVFAHTHTQFVENDIPCVDLCFLMLSPIVFSFWLLILLTFWHCPESRTDDQAESCHRRRNGDPGCPCQRWGASKLHV